MTSITPQNLGAVAASADTSHANRANAAERQSAGGAPSHQQVIQQTQAVARVTSTKAESDKKRSPQVPKKTEAGFSSQEDAVSSGISGKRRPVRDEEEEEEEQESEEENPLDVIA